LVACSDYPERLPRRELVEVTGWRSQRSLARFSSPLAEGPYSGIHKY